MAQVHAQSRSAKLRCYFVKEGILDGLTSEPTVLAQFAAWDVQLGISGKARRLQEIDLAHRRHKTIATMKARTAAEGEFINAAHGSDFWGSGLLAEADALLREEIEWLEGQRRPWQEDNAAGTASRTGFGYPCGCVQIIRPPREGGRRCAMHRALFDVLAFGLQYRFARWASALGGWPLDAPLEVPDAWDATIGERLSLVISEDYPIWIARQWLESFYQQAKGKLEAAETAAHEPGRPVEDDRESLRRMGHTYFLLGLKKPPRPQRVDIGQGYDRQAGRDHTGSDCPCFKTVGAHVARAAEILRALET